MTTWSCTRFIGTLAAISVLSFGMSGCASMQSASTSENAAISDPIEPLNRMTFAFNDMLDQLVLSPVVKVYRAVVPQVARNAVHNVLDNLKSPVYLANELLQGDLEGAGTVLRRFATNTTMGIGGIMDVASRQGHTYQPEDFGQTLATWGVGTGPYVVLPLFGPSNLRDGLGMVADMAMDPLYWYAHNNDKDALQYTRAGLTGLSTKDRVIDMQQDLRKNSGDYYTALQSVYLQRRKALVTDLDSSQTDLPDM